MCGDDVKRWVAKHESMFPGFRAWLLDRHRDEITAIVVRWGSFFGDLSVEELECASEELWQRENKPRAFGDHPFAVMRIAKGERGKSKAAATTAQDIRCQVCHDTGKRSVFLCGTHLIVELQRLGYIDEWGNWLRELDDAFFGRVVHPEQPGGPLKAAMERLLGREIVVSNEPVLTLYASRSHSILCRCVEDRTATAVPRVMDSRQDWTMTDAAKLFDYVRSEVTRVLGRQGVPFDQMTEADF